jgi:hypothetical protein
MEEFRIKVVEISPTERIVQFFHGNLEIARLDASIKKKGLKPEGENVLVISDIETPPNVTEAHTLFSQAASATHGKRVTYPVWELFVHAIRWGQKQGCASLRFAHSYGIHSLQQIEAVKIMQMTSVLKKGMHEGHIEERELAVYHILKRPTLVNLKRVNAHRAQTPKHPPGHPQGNGQHRNGNGRPRRK